jgi:hypothetical protein
VEETQPVKTPQSRAVLPISPERYHRWSIAVLCVLSVIGIAWRLRNYLHAKSFWLDELTLINQISRKSLYALLFSPQPGQQIAPPGYFVLQKLVSWCSNMSELSQRVVPFAAAVIGVVLAFEFARQAERLSLSARAVFLALFALCPVLGLYSAESKQYGLDAVVTMGLLVLAAPEGLLVARWKRLAVGGSVAVCFSQPAIFTLAALVVLLLIEGLKTRTPDYWRRCFFVLMVWAAACILVFGPIFVAGGAGKDIHRFWRSAFAPGLPGSLHELKWYLNSFLNYACVAFGPARRYGIGLSGQDFVIPSFGFLFLMVAGWASLRSAWPRMALLVVTVLAIALVASTFRIYPFRGRLLIYLLPLAFLSVGAYFHSWKRARGLPTLLGAILICIPYATGVVQGWIQPFDSPQTRTLMQCIGQHQSKTDKFILLPLSGSSFDFYRTAIGVGENRIRRISVNLRAKSGKELFKSKIAQLRLESRSRLWLVGLHRPHKHFKILGVDIANDTVVKCEVEGAKAWLFEGRGLPVATSL